MSTGDDIMEWLPIAAAKLGEMDESEREVLLGLINHARDAGQKPGKRWFEQGELLISKIGVEVFNEFFPKFMNEASETFKNKVNYSEDANQAAKLELMVGGSWLVFISGSLAGVQAVASAFKPSPNGLRNQLGNVTRKVLQSIASSDSLQSLEAIKQINKLMARYPKGNEGHQFRLTYAAVGKAKNLSIKGLDALVETNVDSVSYEGTIAFGAYSAKIAFDHFGGVALFWAGPEGKLLNGVPVEVKTLFDRELKELKKKVKDIRTSISLKSHRLESEMRSENCRAYGVWQKEFLGNPVTRSIVERLIWSIEYNNSFVAALVREGELVDIDGNILREIQDKCNIKLWHPLDANFYEVLQWRRRIETLKIVQPFKQAHREVYVLTDAERKGAIFSNRFSGHILKGPQFLELCQARNWKSSRWKNCATVEIESINMSALVQLDWEIDLNEGCPSYLTPGYVFTKQISFSTGDLQCLLEQVPQKTFSEIMRDVDLFVGVSSVANDPNWRDHGNRQGRNYWWSNAFGELSASAETRRDLLERLLPSLADISDRCHLEGRFLVVRGDLRIYRIHLGSSNIQMEPNNQYLCIVPGQNDDRQAKDETIFLPFVGDATLSLIISKALLLAKDKDIKDAEIMEQILEQM